MKQHQFEVQKLALEKKALRQKLKGMEKKLLKGDRRGGIAEMASHKEKKLQKNQDRLSKRSSLCRWACCESFYSDWRSK